jgi:hypothetical protein
MSFPSHILLAGFINPQLMRPTLGHQNASKYHHGGSTLDKYGHIPMIISGPWPHQRTVASMDILQNGRATEKEGNEQQFTATHPMNT